MFDVIHTLKPPKEKQLLIRCDFHCMLAITYFAMDRGAANSLHQTRGVLCVGSGCIDLVLFMRRTVLSDAML